MGKRQVSLGLSHLQCGCDGRTRKGLVRWSGVGVGVSSAYGNEDKGSSASSEAWKGVVSGGDDDTLFGGPSQLRLLTLRS